MMPSKLSPVPADGGQFHEIMGEPLSYTVQRLRTMSRAIAGLD
jgi:hypothetical protein